jgi:hypothetical protein
MSNRSLLGWGFLAFLLWPLAVSQAADQPQPRVPVARYLGESGGMLRKTAPNWPWQPVRTGSELYSGDLLVGGFEASLASLNGDVGLAVRGDMSDHSPFPVMETALVLHQAKDVDLDFTLERGRITVTNQKKTGSAKVRIHIRDRAAEFTLQEPGASFALEIYGRWPTGVPFKMDAKPEYGPPLALVMLVLQGEVAVKGPKREGTLKAPPGPAMFMTDSLDDPSPEPLFIDKLPAWAAGGPPSEKFKKMQEILGKFRKAVMTQPVDEVLREFVKSDDPFQRKAGIVFMGALDDLEGLGEALMNAKHLDVWDAAVLALRHWIGRKPGQDQLLYKGLMEKRGFKPVQAEAILSLLHSFSEEDLNTPETYETLINYLENEKLGVRGLAYWHLIRLVPDGQKFGYDPLAPKEKRDAAVKEWRRLIPAGKLPPKPKLDDK